MFGNLLLLIMAIIYVDAIRNNIRYQANGLETVASIKPLKQTKSANLVTPIYSFNMK